jgi:hypothetical protein
MKALVGVARSVFSLFAPAGDCTAPSGLFDLRESFEAERRKLVMANSSATVKKRKLSYEGAEEYNEFAFGRMMPPDLPSKEARPPAVSTDVDETAVWERQEITPRNSRTPDDDVDEEGVISSAGGAAANAARVVSGTRTPPIPVEPILQSELARGIALELDLLAQPLELRSELALQIVEQHVLPKLELHSFLAKQAAAEVEAFENMNVSMGASMDETRGRARFVLEPQPFGLQGAIDQASDAHPRRGEDARPTRRRPRPRHRVRACACCSRSW